MHELLTNLMPSAVGAHPDTSTMVKPVRSDFGLMTGTPLLSSRVRMPAGLLLAVIPWENSSQRLRTPVVCVYNMQP